MLSTRTYGQINLNMLRLGVNTDFGDKAMTAATKNIKDLGRDELARMVEDLRAENLATPHSMSAMLKANPVDARRIAKEIAPLKRSKLFWFIVPIALAGPILGVAALIASLIP